MPTLRLPRPPSRRLRRGAGLVLAALLAFGAGGLALRPQLLVLAAEGFPRATWPAPGHFVTVEGVEVPDDPRPGPALPEAARDLFAESGGRALLAERGGVLIAEGYGEGLGRDDALNSFSLVKSLVGALVLRAVADGRLPGLDARLPAILGAEAPDVSLREALSMTSGLVLPDEPPKTGTTPLDDGAFSPLGPLGRLHAGGLDAILPDLAVDPALRGTFHYQSANTALLGRAVEAAYGRPLPEVLSDLIWAPAGAADARWRAYPGGDEVSAYCCLYARPLDWLRVGRFLLANGTAAEPFLPDALWRALVLPDLAPEARRAGAYGLHLRHDVLDRPGEALAGPFAYLLGQGGQVVYLVPGADLVAVRFGERPQRLHSTLYALAPGAPRALAPGAP